MAQLNLYLDADTSRRMQEVARREGVSVSRWARERLRSALDRGWSREFFDLFGSIEDDGFQRPAQHGPTSDVARDAL